MILVQKLLTEYSSIDSLSDVDITTQAPTTNQVLKWDGTKFVPADDNAGIASINTFATVTGDTGTTTANSQTDTLTIAGGTNITTSVSGDTLTVDFNGTLTTTLAALTDTNVSGITQGDSLYWNGTSWIVTRSPITWWEIGAVGASDFTFTGPGFRVLLKILQFMLCVACHMHLIIALTLELTPSEFKALKD